LTFEKLFLTGPKGSAYRLGDALEVHDRGRHLGSLDPVEVSPDRSEVHIGRFVPSAQAGEQRRFGALLLLELTLFLAERFAGIQSVHFTLTREIELHGDGALVAAARVELLRRIGAVNVTAHPKPDPGRPGNFVVQGVWSYTEDNLFALRAALQEERDLFREQTEDHSRQGRGSYPRLWRVRQWLARRGGGRPER
jgi:hypothetical protein